MDNIKVTGISSHEGLIRLYWESKEYGFGTYDISFNNSTEDNISIKHLIGNSECMDNAEDKEFLKSLLSSLVEQIEIQS